MNITIMTGRLVSVPQIRIMQIGNEQIGVCYFTIACNDSIEESKDNKATDFFECIAFNYCGQQIAERFVKGAKIVCRGTMKNHCFKDINGTKHFTQVFVIDWAEYGDTESSLKKASIGNQASDFSVVSELRDTYRLYDKICDEGFLCVDEDAYYSLAASI